MFVTDKQPKRNMKSCKKYLIGGQALVKLGSQRSTNDIDYLIYKSDDRSPFIHDKSNNIDYVNANGHPFFQEVYNLQQQTCELAEIACPQVLLELKAFAFVQHCKNFHFKKADDCEYDIKFLVRKFKVNKIKIANKYISNGELFEVMKVISSVKF